MDAGSMQLNVGTAGGFPESRERRLKLLEERKSRYEESEHCEFTADEALIGLIIGKQGEKLTRVAREYKVEIRVLPDDGGIRRVRIYGQDRLSVDKARNVLEYVCHEYAVPEGMAGWILGKKGGSIKEVQREAGLHSAWFDDANSVIVLCGLRHAVEQAVLLLNANAQHFQHQQSASSHGPGAGDEPHATPEQLSQIGVDGAAAALPSDFDKLTATVGDASVGGGSAIGS